jgi:hypothetical protein
MVAQKGKKEEYESDVVSFLRSGTVSIVEAVAVNLPDVFAAEIVPKLDWISTLNLAQVSKSYRDAVWSVEGVRSMDAKMEAYSEKFGKVFLPSITLARQSTATCPRSGPTWSLGRTSIRENPRLGRLPCTLRLTVTDR